MMKKITPVLLSFTCLLSLSILPGCATKSQQSPAACCASGEKMACCKDGAKCAHCPATGTKDKKKAH
jgi:hypothetical protein